MSTRGKAGHVVWKLAIVLLATIAGGAVGYYSERLSDVGVRAISGAVVAGLVSVLVLLRLGTRRATWTKLSIKVPLIGDAEFDMAKTDELAFALDESQRA